MGDGVNNNSESKPAPLDQAVLVAIQSRIEKLEREQTEEKEESGRQAERQLVYNRRLVLFTGLLFVTSAISNLMMFWQARTSEESANAAARAASTAEETLKSGKESFGATIVQMKAQSDIAKQSADAATRAAEIANATLEDGRKSFELSMRPYITIPDVQFVQAPKAGQLIQIRCMVRNDGKTPAAGLRGVASLIWHDNKVPFRFSPPGSILRRSADVGGVGVPLTYTTKAPVPQKLIDDSTESDRFTMVYYGEVSFDSRIFAKRTPYDTIKFCFYYNWQTKDFSQCFIPEYNTIVEIR